jgi:hypothetical protein
MSGNTWTNFVKDFARENGTSYMEAMKHPDLSVAYKTHKKGVKTKARQDNFEFLKKSAIELAGDAPTETVKNEENENIILQMEEINV